MSNSYSSIISDIISNVKNNPSLKTRGNVLNSILTDILTFAKDRLLGKTIDNTNLADTKILYYDEATDTFKFMLPLSGGTGTNDHYDLLHIGTITHEQLDGYFRFGENVEVQFESIEILNLKRNFNVVKNSSNPTMQCNGVHTVVEDWTAGDILTLRFLDTITLGNGVSVQDGISFAFQTNANFTTHVNDIILFKYDGTFLREINGLSLIRSNILDIENVYEEVQYNTSDISDNAEQIEALGGVYKKGVDIPLSGDILQIPSGYDSFTLTMGGDDYVKLISITPSNGGANFTKGKIIRLKLLNDYFFIYHNAPPVGNNYGVRLKRGANYTPSKNDILVLMLEDDGYWYEVGDLTKVADNECVNNMVNYANSPMLVSGGEISLGTNADTIKIGALKGFLRVSNNLSSNLVEINLSETDNIEVPTLDTMYDIVLDYNAGTPQITLSDAVLNENTEIPIGYVMKDSTGVFYREGGFRLQEAAKRLHDKDTIVNKVKLQSGCKVSDGDRYIKITSGVAYSGINKYFLNEVDTSGTDTFGSIYNDGSWQFVSGQTQVNNTQYNDFGTGLATLANNQYGIFWVWKNPTSQQTSLLMGTASYTLAGAQAVNEIISIPEKLSKLGVLIGKIIIKKGADDFIFQSLDNTLAFTGAYDHNDLLNKGTITHEEIDAKFKKGSDIASASTITIPADGEFCEVTGTTAIDLIETTGYVAGKTIALKFLDVCTLNFETATSGTAVGMYLVKGSNYTTVAGDIIILKFDGTVWQEVNNLTKESGTGGEANTASNVGTSGIGIFKQKSGINLEFKKLLAGDNITLTETENDEIEIKGSDTSGNIGGKLYMFYSY